MNKLQAVHSILNDASAALILTPQNRFYFTGFTSSDGVLLVTQQKTIFLIDGRYFESASQSAADCEVILLKRLSLQLPQILEELKIESLLFETDVTCADIDRYRSFLSVKVEPSKELQEVITNLRNIKSQEELGFIKSAQKLTDEAFSYICGFIKSGMSEKEVALALEFFIRQKGSQGVSFDFIVVSGENSSKPHGVPSEKIIQNGDFITMDFGAVVNEYRSDMTRTVAVGEVSSEKKKVYETVLKANIAGLNSIKNGVKASDADKAARDVIAFSGYGEYFSHSTGHGVGIDIHEPISLSSASKQTLQTGNVVTVEPGVYIPGKFGVRIEDMVFVTDEGCINLTESDKNLIIL